MDAARFTIVRVVGDAPGEPRNVASEVEVEIQVGPEGLAGPANRAVQQATTPYVVLLGPGITATPADLDALVHGLVHDPTALSHAATIVDPAGVAELGVGGWEPSMGRAAVSGLGLQGLLPTLGLDARPARRERLDVDWTSVDALAVRRSDFLAVGGFDDGVVGDLIAVSLGRRARNHGLRQVLRSDVQVVRSVARTTAGATAPAEPTGATPRSVVPDSVVEAASDQGASAQAAVDGIASHQARLEEALRLQGAALAAYTERYHPVEAAGIRAVLAVGTGLRAARRRLVGDDAAARAYRSYAAGVVTGRGYVDGAEVVRRRADETRAPAGPGQA